MNVTNEIKKKLQLRHYFDVSGSKAFARRLKELRMIAGLTQAELAEELGVSRGAIGYYEKNERVPDIDFFYNVACKFGVTFDFLFGESANAFSEYTSISQKTFLSDCAISKIFELEDCEQILSRIIEHEKFNELFESIKRYVDSEYWSAFPYDNEFKVFIISKIFTQILIEVKKQFSKETSNYDKMDSDKIETNEDKAIIKKMQEEYQESIAGKTAAHFYKLKDGDENGNDQ